MSAAAEWLDDSLGHLEFADVLPFVHTLTEAERTKYLAPLFDWEGAWAREAQREPLGAWRVWLILAGRGFGKTRTGAEWVRKQVEMGTARRIALVARTTADGRDVMIEGESGILAVSPPWMRPHYEPSKRRVTWRNDDGTIRTIATVYSADEPDLLRGPQHDAAWCDELASWRRKEAWDNLMLGLRLGRNPRCVVTTTPKPTMLVKDLASRKSTVTTGGSTYDNIRNVAAGFIEDILDRFEGTHMGRQELYAELLAESEHALWKRRWINDNRWDVATMGDHPELDRLVVAIDPAGSSDPSSSETGIVAAGRALVTDEKGVTKAHGFVVADGSGHYSPDEWAKVAVDLFHEFEADVIVGEKNNGGEMVEAVVSHYDEDVPFKEVWASRGKQTRADPIAQLYEQGRIHHVGLFRDLEDQQCQWEPDSGHKSPDRIDADVWALTELIPPGRAGRITTGLDLSMPTRRSPWRGE